VTAGRADPYLPLQVANLELWLDAADTNTITHSSNAVSYWADKSGNGRHATTSLGSPTLNSTSGPNNKPVIEIRRAGGVDALSIGGTSFFAKEHYYVFRSVGTTFDYYGGILGHGGNYPATRSSSYLFEIGQTYFHGNQYPAGVSKNGTALSGNFNLGTINQHMIIKITNTDANTGPHSNYRVGTIAGGNGYCASVDIAEILAFSTSLSQEKANKIESYLAHKWGLTQKPKFTFSNTPVSATTANYPANHLPTHALDGNTGTKFFTNEKAGHGLILNVGDSIISELSVTSADLATRDPTSYEIHGSLDGTSFSLVASGSMPAFTARYQKADRSVFQFVCLHLL
jgi:hypothetical protein